MSIIKKLLNVALLVATTSSYAIGISTTTVILQPDTHYSHSEHYSSSDLTNKSRNELVSIRTKIINGLNRNINILKLIAGNTFDYKVPLLNKILYNKIDIIDDITRATVGYNTLVDEINEVIDNRISMRNASRVSMFIEDGTTFYRSNKCKIQSQLLSLTPGQMAVIKMKCTTRYKGSVTNYMNVSLDLSYRLHVGREKPFQLSPFDETQLKKSLVIHGSQDDFNVKTVINYSIKLNEA
ncbi:hypothetical protein V6259_13075 [Marinomonas sp. TI.3.20]|uniref:hypothetical protein n=1 Tax=Marinomonas sp. TI.3.20 TaxID=3121296 RepID=UPI00311FAF20